MEIEKEINREITCNIINPESKITFAIENKWFMELGVNGIRFNREEYPDCEVNDFAKDFMELMEKSYKIKFLAKE